MTSGEPVQRVRIYLNERDMRAGQSLYQLVLERLQREGATGATALRGLAGFGPGHRMRAAPAAVGDALPVVIEWVDRVERVARVMPALDDLLEEALVTIEELRAYRARLRSAGPFGNHTIGEMMAGNALAAPMSATAREGVRTLLLRDQPLLPVLDERRRVIAALTSDDLMRRAGLPLPLDVARALRPEEREDLLRVVADRPLAELVTQEPRTGYIQASVPQAVSTLIEWGLDALPVVDREGAFAGLFGVEQALRAALEAGRGADGAVQNAEAPPAVRLLMQTSVPSVPAAMGAAEALGRVLAAPERFVLVVEDGRPAGVIDAAGVLALLEAPLRYEWLQGLRAPAAPPAFAGAPPELTAAGLSAPAATIDELATEDTATRLLLEQGCARLVVVNEAGQLAGLLGRRALLRALSQEHV